MPQTLKDRGMDDPKIVSFRLNSDFLSKSEVEKGTNQLINYFLKIKEFGYRDDGLAYWAVIKKYTRAILDIYYKNDQEIIKDTEVQDWIGEVKVNKKIANIDH